MATIGDKKVSLALQDGSSINLNKPKVLPASITKIADIKEPGWYIGGTAIGSSSGGGQEPASLEDESTPVTLSSDDGVSGQTITSDEKFDDSEINYVITDAPSTYNEIFNLYVYPLYLTPDTTGTLYMSGYQYIVIISSCIYFGEQSAIVDSSQNMQKDLEWTRIPFIDDVITEISDSYVTGDSSTALSTRGGKNIYNEVIKKLQVYEMPTDDDLNNFINYNCIYYAETGNSVTNKPANVDAFSIHIEFASNNSTGEKYVTQVLFSLNNTTTSGKIFTRHYNGSSKTFTSWKELGASDAIDNLTSTDTDKALSANQGKVLNDKISNLTKSDVGLDQVDNTADANKSVKYATSAGSVAWNNVTGKPSTFAPESHNHTKSQITDFPASLKNPTALTIQTNGATAATYDGSAAKSVNITKASIGLGNVNNTADADKSVKFATKASKLGSSTVGSETKPMYLNAGTPTASSSTVGSAANPVYMKNGTITACAYTFSASTTDLTAGTSTLATNEIRFIYE